MGNEMKLNNDRALRAITTYTHLKTSKLIGNYDKTCVNVEKPDPYYVWGGY